MGVPEEKGECNTLPLFTDSVMTLGTTTERSDTPLLLMVVLRITGMHLCGGIDCQTHCGEVTHRTDVDGTGKWSSL